MWLHVYPPQGRKRRGKARCYWTVAGTHGTPVFCSYLAFCWSSAVSLTLWLWTKKAACGFTLKVERSYHLFTQSEFSLWKCRVMNDVFMCCPHSQQITVCLDRIPRGDPLFWGPICFQIVEQMAIHLDRDFHCGLDVIFPVYIVCLCLCIFFRSICHFTHNIHTLMQSGWRFTELYCLHA